MSGHAVEDQLQVPAPRLRLCGKQRRGRVLDAAQQDHDIGAGEATRMIETNLLGSMYMVHAALPHLMESKGTIVQVSSTSGRVASAAAGVYAATKFGINAFSESLRQEVTAHGVRVVVVEPGFVATELTSHITDPAMLAVAQKFASSIRTLQPEDIANAVVYAANQPAHVAINEILIRPTDQTQ